jgi:predicted MFS family arabinose efflux permease
MTTQMNVTEKTERLILILLASIQFAHVMDFMVMMPLGPQLMRSFQIDTSQFGYIVSAYGISSGIGGILAAPFLDQFDRKKFLQLCLVGLCAGTVLCALAESAWVLMLGRCVAGIFGGILGALVQSIISDVFPLNRRGFAISRVMLAFSLASVLGVPTGLLLANRFGWHSPFLVISALLFLLFVSTQFFFPSLKGHIDPSVSTKERVSQLIGFFGNKEANTGFLASILIIMGQFMVIPFISPYLVYNLGFGEENLPLLYLLGGVSSIFTIPLIGKLTDKLNPYRASTYGILISIVPLFLLTHLTTSNHVFILMTTSLFMVCMGGRMVPFTAMLTNVVPPQKRGAYLSITASIQALAQGSAAFLAAKIVSTGPNKELIGYGLSGWLAAVFSVATVLLGLQIAKAARNSEQQKHLKVT